MRYEKITGEREYSTSEEPYAESCPIRVESGGRGKYVEIRKIKNICDQRGL